MSHSLQLKKLAPLGPGRAASSAQQHRDYREAGFLTAYLKKKKDRQGEMVEVLTCSFCSPLSVPPPVSSEESRRGRRLKTSSWETEGAPLGMDSYKTSVPREPAFSGKTRWFCCTCKSSPFAESLPQTTWFFLRGVCHPMGLVADFCGSIST